MTSLSTGYERSFFIEELCHSINISTVSKKKEIRINIFLRRRECSVEKFLIGYNHQGMQNLSPGFYFSLDGFEHKELFDQTVYVWEALHHIHEYLSEKKLGHIATSIPNGAHLINPELIAIGEGTIVEPGAYIQGPCIIGKNCQIRHGAYIRGGVITGDRCVIGHATEVKHSILLNDAHAAHFNYVGDSILGAGVNLGAGSMLANLRLDRKTVLISQGGRKIDTQLKKFGAVLGDGVQIGCNAVINPGTLLGPRAICYPCLNIAGVIAPNATIKE